MTRQNLQWAAKEIERARSRKQKGKAGELFILHLMNCELYQARRTCSYGGCDLEVINTITHEITRIEVKISTRNRKGVFKFCLRKQDRHGTTDVTRSDWLILLCWKSQRNYGVFAVPVAETGTAKFLTIQADWNAYSGRYAKFKQEHYTTWQEVFTVNISQGLS